VHHANGALFYLTHKTKNMDDFDQIFYSETSTTSTTKKFNFDKPPGWNKKPKKKNKLSEFFRIMRGGLMRHDMDPSDHRKFDIWFLDIKILIFCTIFAIIMFNTVISTSFGSEKYTEGAENHTTLLDQAIDYISKQQEPQVEIKPKQQVVIIKDSLINIDSVAYVLRQSDSILNLIRHMDDSLSTP